MSTKKSRRAASNRLSELSLTVYPGYALVQGSYPVRLSEGPNKFQVEGLPTHYEPNSLYFDTFRGPGEITLGAASYRAANLSPATLLQRSLNKRVTVRYGGQLEAEQHEITGTLVSFAGNTALLKLPKGGGVREIRNVVGYTFGDVPEGLSNTPSLFVAVEATEAGDYVATLLYKAHGLNWTADYKWIYDEKAGLITIDGSVLVSNSSGATFPDASLKVVAGDAGYESDAMLEGAAMPMAAAAAPMGGAARSSRSVRQATNESLGQVKVFTIPGRSNVEDGEGQKIPFLVKPGVPVQRENRVRAHYGWHHARGARVEAPVHTILIVQNDDANQLGVPLPGGAVAVMQRDESGALLKSGGAYMQDAAVGEEVKLQTGTDFDLKAERIVLDLQREETVEPLPQAPAAEESVVAAARPSVQRAQPQPPVARKKVVQTKTCAIELFNGKSNAVEFVIEEVTSGDELTFKGEHGFTQTAAGQHERRVKLDAGATAKVEYTLVQTHYEDVR